MIASRLADGPETDDRPGAIARPIVDRPAIDDPRADRDWPEAARRRLLGVRRGPAAWGYRAASSPAAEPSSLGALGLLADPDRRGDGGREVAVASARRLASTQRGDGSLGATPNLPEAGWPTPFALLLWSSLGGFEAARSKAVGWLLKLEGRWVARIADDPMGHDTTIVGWPWVADTHSWVEPTAMALLALAGEGLADHPRSHEGVRLLLDRAIPTGGWNLGNPMVFGTALRPLPGPTGLALLALARLGRRSKIVDRAIAYLRPALAETLAPVSLGWGLLGLRAWGAEPDEGRDWLASAFEKLATSEPRPVELAMLLLASGSLSLELLGVSTGRRDAAPARPLSRTERKANPPFLAVDREVPRLV